VVNITSAVSRTVLQLRRLIVKSCLWDMTYRCLI